MMRIRLLTDIRSGLQLPQRGPANQTLELAAALWRQLQHLGDAGASITMQWVPGHAGIRGNETADRQGGSAMGPDPSLQVRRSPAATITNFLRVAPPPPHRRVTAAVPLGGPLRGLQKRERGERESERQTTRVRARERKSERARE